MGNPTSPITSFGSTAPNGGGGGGGRLNMDALLAIYGVTKPGKKDPMQSVYGPQTGTPGPQVDMGALFGSAQGLAGNVAPVNYQSNMPPADGRFWLQDIVNRAHNAALLKKQKKK